MCQNSAEVKERCIRRVAAENSAPFHAHQVQFRRTETPGSSVSSGSLTRDKGPPGLAAALFSGLVRLVEKPGGRGLRRLSMIVAERSTEALAACDGTLGAGAFLW